MLFQEGFYPPISFEAPRYPFPTLSRVHGGKFISKSGKRALNANGANVEGAVLLRNGLKAQGEVNLVGATIGGSLECDSGQFFSKGETPTLDASGAKIQGHVFFARRVQG